MNDRRALIFVGWTLLVLLGPIGALWGVLDGLPAFGHGDGHVGIGEAILKGTNLSAPLAPLVVLALGLLLVRRDDKLGFAADVLLILVGILFVAASVGEPFVEKQADTPGAFLVFFRLIVYACDVAMIVLATRDLERRRKPQPQMGPA